jgi:hypothetical protein
MVIEIRENELRKTKYNMNYKWTTLKIRGED